MVGTLENDAPALQGRPLGTAGATAKTLIFETDTKCGSDATGG